jgi:homocysteine S-methyltransferase
MDFLDEMQHRVLPGDGAMGTRLMESGVPLGRCFEELFVSRADLVRGIHEQYVAAGARVIETNSFGANAVRLAEHGLEHRVSEINWSAAQLAKDVAKGKGVYVAGSVGPLGISAGEAAQRGIDRYAVFTDQLGALLDGGCNLIFLETFLDLEEMLVALHAKQSLHHCPVVALLPLTDSGELLRAAEKLREAGADVVGVNCVEDPSVLRAISDSGPIAAFPNAGIPQEREGRLVYPVAPSDFVASAIALPDTVRLIGGCCGVGPRHIAALAKYLQEHEAQR